MDKKTMHRSDTWIWYALAAAAVVLVAGVVFAIQIEKSGFTLTTTQKNLDEMYRDQAYP